MSGKRKSSPKKPKKHRSYECDLIRLFLPAYASEGDTRLSPEERLRVKNHLTYCPECRKEHSKWKQFNEAVKNNLLDDNFPADMEGWYPGMITRGNA